MAERYCVNVRGPDDVIATRDYPEAVALAQLLNADFAAHVAKAHHEFDPLMWAVPGIYPYDEEHHAANLAHASVDYAAVLGHVRAA